MRPLARALAVGAAASLSLGAPMAVASTVTLASVVETDDLGYTCIPEAQLEVAFRATDKGAMLPQTCLPEPCHAQLSPADLAQLIGYQARPEQWDDYISRYADTCVDEARVAWADPTDAGITDVVELAFRDDGPRGGGDFWDTILRPPPRVTPPPQIIVTSGPPSTPTPQTRIAAAPPVPVPTPFSFPTVSSPKILVQTPGTPTTTITPTAPNVPTPSPVPLPASVLFLLGALAVLRRVTKA